MAKIEITINGEAYPCYQTMGAMLRFKQETGKEITEINAESFTDLVTYIWCCVVSACKREGKAFDMPLMDFADAVTPDEMGAWTDHILTQPGDTENEETAQTKKKVKG